MTNTTFLELFVKDINTPSFYYGTHFNVNVLPSPTLISMAHLQSPGCNELDCSELFRSNYKLIYNEIYERLPDIQFKALLNDFNIEPSREFLLLIDKYHINSIIAHLSPHFKYLKQTGMYKTYGPLQQPLP